MLGHPKYTYKDKVRFKFRNLDLVGTIEIVDSYGTMEQNKEPSYDIVVEMNNTLYKHIVESSIVEKVNNNDCEIIRITSRDQFSKAADFFSNKWGVPKEAYLESMEESLENDKGVPSWFIIENKSEIIGGLGVIENDFHKRKDLRPNICAVYIKEEYQKNRISCHLLDTVCSYLKEKGLQEVYLITTHTQYYEKVGFTYYGEIEEDSGDKVRCYYRKF